MQNVEALDGSQVVSSDLKQKSIYKECLRFGFFELGNRAIPMTLTMLSTTVGGYFGVIFVSKLGLDALAVNNFVSTIQFFTVMPINAAIAYQTNKIQNNPEVIAKDHVRNLQRSTFMTTFIFTPITAGVMFSMVPLVKYFSGSNHIARQVGEYFIYFMPGIPAMFMLNNCRQCLNGENLAWRVLPFYFGYQLLDTFLSYIFVFGKFHLPKMGFAGLGLANTVSIWLTTLSFMAYMYERYEKGQGDIDIEGNYINSVNIFEWKLRKSDGFDSEKYSEHIDHFLRSVKSLFKESYIQLKENFFYSLRIFADQGLLFALSLFLGRLGKDQNAAQEAAYQYIPICYTLVFGLKDGIGKAIGNSGGKKDLATTKRLAYLGLILSMVMTGIPFVLFLVAANPLLKIFLHGAENNDEVIKLGRNLLWINGAALVLDGVRQACLSTLNNLNTKYFPMGLIGITLSGILLAYFLGLHTNLESIGIMMSRTLVFGLGALLSLGYMIYLLETTKKYENNVSHLVNTVPDLTQQEREPLLPNNRTYGSSESLISRCLKITWWGSQEARSPVTLQVEEGNSIYHSLKH